MCLSCDNRTPDDRECCSTCVRGVTTQGPDLNQNGVICPTGETECCYTSKTGRNECKETQRARCTGILKKQPFSNQWVLSGLIPN